MNTRSVELDGDLIAIAALRTTAGEDLAPVKWDGPTGGHHVSGVLSFPRPASLNRSLALILRGIADVPERVFEWTR